MSIDQNITDSHKGPASLKELFRSSIRWNVSGSAVFEIIKMLHHLALFAALPLATYGEVGITFSLIYAAIAIASLGIEAAIPPFIRQVLQSRQAFTRHALLLTLTQLPFLLLAASCTLFFSASPITFALVLSEGMRSFFRLLLHSSFLHKHAMLIDLFVTSCALLSMWVAHVALGLPLTSGLIFGTYLAGSLVCVVLMARNALRLANSLPNNGAIAAPPFRRVMRIRLASYVPTLARTLFSSNVLTPLLAVHFGLSTAATFKLASYVADGIRAIVKAIVRFSGGALLGRLKGQSMRVQRTAFALLSRQLLNVLAGTLVALLCCSPFYVLSLTLMPAALFLLMSFIEHLDALYTQFYTVQERPGLPMSLKILEIALFAVVIFLVRPQSPLMLLTLLAFIKAFILGAFVRNGTKDFGLTLRVRA